MADLSVKRIVDNAKFKPGVLGLFINHNFLIRTGLNAAIKREAKRFSGIMLDFGCGTKPYKDYFINVEQYVGVDLEIPGRNQSELQVDFFYDGHTIPFQTGHFDGLLCTEVLEHVFNLEELLGEINRVLKPGGIALLTTPFMWEEHEMPYDFARYTTPALEHLYRKYGFAIRDHYKTGDFVRILFQFVLAYIKNLMPEHKRVRQILLLPFIFPLNFLGLLLGFILPTRQTAYFNNIFVLEKILDLGNKTNKSF